MNDIGATPEPCGTTIRTTDADTLAEIRESQIRLFAQIRRLHELLECHVALLDETYVSIKRTAKITGLSDSHIRQAVISGDLPASNVGTTKRPVYRIGKADLAAWLEGRKGRGRPLGRPALRALIDEQLPGLSGRRSK
jgi:excisionase family DNA binding protein